MIHIHLIAQNNKKNLFDKFILKSYVRKNEKNLGERAKNNMFNIFKTIQIKILIDCLQITNKRHLTPFSFLY